MSPLTCFSNRCLIILGFLALQFNGLAQKTITISIINVEFNNPLVNQLKTELKSNDHVQGLKSSFANATTTFSLSSELEPGDLWDELTEEVTDGFKVLAMDAKSIRLTLMKNTPEKPTAVKTAASNKDKNCGCDYFPLCNVDMTKSFMGKIWKGFNNNGKITYYYCANGVLEAKFEFFDNFEGTSLGYATYIALKYNEPSGTNWKQTVDINGVKYYYESTIKNKGMNIRVNGVKYTDVIKLHRKVNAASFFYLGQPQNLMEIENNHTYYVKNVGEISGDNIEELEDDIVTTKENADGSENFEGTWTNDIPSRMETYSFKPNGTFRHSLKSEFVNTNGEGSWKIDGDQLVLTSNGKSYIINFIKWNNTSTGKPSIVFNHPEYVTEFKVVGAKKPWKNIPAFGNSVKPNVIEKVKLNGIIDPKLVGKWTCKSKEVVNSQTMEYHRTYQFNNDGSVIYSNSIPALYDNSFEKYEWRVDNGILKTLRSIGGDKCIIALFYKQVTKDGKAALNLGSLNDFYFKE